MCYYVSSRLTKQEIYSIENDLNVKWEEEYLDLFHVTSGFGHPRLPVVTADGHFKLYRWGLIPSWVKDWQNAVKLRTQTLNSIGETIDSKPSFRGAVNAGRLCVVPVNGFYEWHHHSNGNKYPHFIYPKDKSYFLLAGLYEQWTNKALDEVHNTFSIITTSANARMEWIHNSKMRMPAILSLPEAKAWLDRELPFNEKKQLLHPYDVNLMADHSIGKLITSRKENPNQEAVAERVDYPELSIC